MAPVLKTIKPTMQSDDASCKSRDSAREKALQLVPRVTLRQLSYFVATARCESIARAAEELHVSSPSISVALTELESIVGVPLFVRRHARGVVLTEAGSELMATARQMLLMAYEFRCRSDARGYEYESIIDFGCLVSLAPLVPAIVSEFYKDCPNVRVRWHEADHASLISGLEAGTINCGLLYDFNIPASITTTIMREMPLQAVLPRHHPMAREDRICLADMVMEPFILLDLPNTQDYLLSTFSELGLEPNIAYRTQSFEMLRSLVANGFGYALLNYCPPYTGLNGGSLVCRPLAESLRPNNMVFAKRHKYQTPSVVEIFKQHIADFVEQQPISA